MDDGERTPQQERRGGNRRRIASYTNSVSLGTLLTIGALAINGLLFMGSLFTIYGQYTSDQTKMRADIKAANDVSDLKFIQAASSMAEVKAEVREMRTRLDEIRTSVGQIQATQQARSLQPQR